MAAAPALKDEIVERLFTVFRDRGFEGASLADLSVATGLGKSSLYHHFPGGKEQMAEAVLGRAKHLIDSEILHTARAGGSLKARIRKVVAALDHMYAGGRTPCVLGQLANASVGAGARQHLREVFACWIEAIAKLASDSGMPPVRAHHFAQDWVARLQGGLLLQAATGDAGAYERTLKALAELGKDEGARAPGA
jgi:TetR/AcrR family transcriptional repressor of lmrAB and yxaGH operons